MVVPPFLRVTARVSKPASHNSPKMHRMPFLLALLLLPTVSLTTLCSHKEPFSRLFDESYNTALLFIYRGAPSHLITSLYTNSLKALLSPHCRCGTDHVAAHCVHSKFLPHAHYTLRALQAQINRDSRVPSARRLLPLFLLHRGHPKDPPTPTEASLALAAKRAVHAALLAVLYGSRGATVLRVRFPPNHVLLHDPEAAKFCPTHPVLIKKPGVPAKKVLAYAVAHVLRLQLSGKNTRLGDRLLAHAVDLAFIAARCQRVDGENVTLPVEFVKKLKRRARRVEERVGVEEGIVAGVVPGVRDFEAGVKVPLLLFGDALEILAGLGGQGRLFVVKGDSGKVKAEFLLQAVRRVGLKEYKEAWIKIQRRLD